MSTGIMSLQRRPRRFVFAIITLLLFISGCASTPKENAVQSTSLEKNPDIDLNVEPEVIREDVSDKSRVVPAEEKISKIDTQANTASKQEPPVQKAPSRSENTPKVSTQVNVEPVKVEPIISEPKPVVPIEKAKPKKETQQKEVSQAEVASVEVIVAMAEKQEESTSQVMPDLEVALDRLPLKVDDGWTLVRESNLKGSCALSYRRLLIEDGQGETPVDVIVQKDLVLFKTRSNIDLGYKGVGITIDANPQIPVESLVGHTSVSFKQRYQALIGEMKEGEVARLTLGFWPTWPVTQTYNVNFELGQFALGHKALMKCAELEKELK